MYCNTIGNTFLGIAAILSILFKFSIDSCIAILFLLNLYYNTNGNTFLEIDQFFKSK